MVDSIGSQPVATRQTVAAVSATPRTSAPAPRNDATTTAQREVSGLTFDTARADTVDEAHVAAVRRAIRNGTYPILPETIADRLLALKLNWSPKK